ncbi:40S ribosomal protein S3 [Sporothrix eucalyptigena]|uniref:40S ribosomal protein S3 n=1 Tax=Sporothrix eucalyptigena TaxID=1812306 RepID=A0ABP0C095_9PEZI
MRGGDAGNVSGDRGAVDGLVSVTGLDYDNDNNNILVLDHVPSEVSGAFGGAATATFPSGDGYYDMGTSVMVPETTGIHYGGSYPVQHGELPTAGSSASGYHHVYYDESNNNMLP